MIRAGLAVLLFPLFLVVMLACVLAIIAFGLIGSLVEGDW